MQHKENFRTSKNEGDSLGKRDTSEKVTGNPAPRKVDRESENTPPDHEVYVDLEPDELHLSEEEQPEEVQERKKEK